MEEKEMQKTHDCECGCGHDHTDDDACDCESQFVTLTMEDGSDVECEILGCIEHNGKDYIALLPESAEYYYVYIYSETEDGGLDIQNIQTEEEFQEVAKLFEAQFIAEEEEEDEE